eukprot:m.183555 g.183555  ORF g.183555 m.183555 type:complete len:271 (+) comp53502_c0_seq1:176-988(+)
MWDLQFPAAPDSTGFSGTVMAEENSLKAPSLVTKLAYTFTRRHQKALDDFTPYVTARWIITGAFLFLYATRTFILQGWYIIAYALGIYLLNLFVQFLTPQIDPEMLADDPESEAALPTKSSDEFRPFVRRLPEFKLWLAAQRAVTLAFLATFFQVFNVPVFWPILVLYFFVLFGISMKHRIQHMIKHKYLPFTVGKPQHKGKTVSLFFFVFFSLLDSSRVRTRLLRFGCCSLFDHRRTLARLLAPSDLRSAQRCCACETVVVVLPCCMIA